MPSIIDLTGQKFGEWTVLKLIGRRAYGGGVYTLWRCECSCGKTGEIPTGNLRGGYSTRCMSCGGKSSADKRGSHRLSRTPTYTRWKEYVKFDCVDSWKDIVNFHRDMGQPPKDNPHIVKKDPANPHSKTNSFWSNHIQKWHDTRGKLIRLLVSVQGMTRAAAEQRVDRVTKQRRYQIIHALTERTHHA